MSTAKSRATTGCTRRRRHDCAPSHRHPFILAAISAVLASFVLAPVFAANETCAVDGPTANCTDVPPAGISYTAGITTVKVGNAEEGETVVTPGNTGIGLYLYGSTGNSDIDVDFQIIPYDTDGDDTTDPVDVVSTNGEDPLMVGDEFILAGAGDPPDTFTIGSEAYTGDELAEFLSDSSVGAGGAVSGFLTVDNEAPFSTFDAMGIAAKSQGGHGGRGSCWTILFIYTHCSDGRNGGSAGSVAVNNIASITVNESAAGRHGIKAISEGGHGGKGGELIGLFADAGAGGDGGDGGDVAVTHGADSSITTYGPHSHGVFARSRGGNGGAAGWIGGAFVWGDAGGDGGDAGKVMVDNDGSILTQGWNSHGILAQSVGAGAGSGSDAYGIYAEGGAGGGESSGADVSINNSGTITTEQDDSFGIIAQSIGGGGGDGGGAGGLFTVGGRAGSGGGSGIVSVTDSGTVQTSGNRSTAIYAQSIGGGGGNGGDAVSFAPTVSIAVGGDGGLGGDGNEIHVTAAGSDIDTIGDDAHGIHAQSVGGGGGNGGLAVAGSIGGPVNVTVALGGNGGGGGSAGTIVDVDTAGDSTIDTSGARSHGIAAQSIGGGGGNGGTSFAGSIGGAISVTVPIGGTGGAAGHGQTVDVDNAASITTSGDLSAGIFTQSIGGGGGSGGFAGSLAVGGGAVGVSLGGDGLGGGVGGQVDVDNAGIITTGGEGAAGIFAQSIGGGGGHGGSALAISGGLVGVSTAVGGTGAAGGIGGAVNIANLDTGVIETSGNSSAGIFAQSVGGGGGSGGDATSIAIGAPLAVAVGVGGYGGTGGIGGKVTVDNQGSIETTGPNSGGVFAQSIGGSGGAGGSATTATVAIPIEIKGVQIPAMSVNVAVGGRGASGGTSDTVKVTNSGEIDTFGFMSSGVFGQSVGGSGGKGGNATNVAMTVDAMFKASVAVGGQGGPGGHGNLVEIGNDGLIHTRNALSAAVFAQSVGGGGGSGGDAMTIDMSLGAPPTSWSDLIPSPSAEFQVAVGGSGDAGGDGGQVTATNTGTIITEGIFANGVMAQSVGGGGGSGGDARSISVEVSANPMDYLPLLDLLDLSTKLVFGGYGAGGGDGDTATLSNEGDILTQGAFSHGIYAQSVGGGGGHGGSAMTVDISSTNVIPDIPVVSDISDLTSISMTLQGSGGAGGHGGDVLVNSDGNIWTEGAFARGIHAQSVAGGGGSAGMYNPLGTTGSDFGDFMVGLLVETEAGISFDGSVGGDGAAGDVAVHHTGDIETLGVAAHGLFAQSVAGGGLGTAERLNNGGDISVTLDGSIRTFGEHSFGIYAQSMGGAGAGNIELTIGQGTVMGGNASGAGVAIAGGRGNHLINEGHILSVAGLDGYAIRASGGHDFVENYGTLTGSLDLGGGDNYLVNYGLITAGNYLDVGLGSMLQNEGEISFGGLSNFMATTLTGDFTQTVDGTLWYDLRFDFGLDTADRLNVSGITELGGTVALALHDTASVMPGEWEQVLISSAGGVTDDNVSLSAPASAVILYTLAPANENDYSLFYDVDFAPDALNRNQRALGGHFNDIQLAGSTEVMRPLTATVVAQPDNASLGAYYDMLSPQIYASNQLGRLFSALDFEQSMHSCAVRDGDFRFSREGECTWMRVSSRDIQYDSRHGLPVARDDTMVVNMGIQRALTANWHGGLAFGFEESEYEIPQVTRRDGSQLQLGGILKGRYGPSAVDLSLTYGSGSFDTRRFMNFEYAGDFTMAERDFSFYSAHAGYSYNVESENWFFRPGLDVGWTDISGDRFHEEGAGPTALYIKGTDDDYVTSRLDLRFGGEISGDNEMLYRPFLNTSYTHILSGARNEIWAKLAGAPESVPYFRQFAEIDDNFTSVGLGIDILGRNNWILSLAYDRQFADEWDIDTYYAKLIINL